MREDPAKVVASAIKLLENKNVAENIIKLIKVYSNINDEVNVKVRASLSHDLRKSLLIKQIEISNSFKINSNFIKIVVANIHQSAFEPLVSYGDLFIIYNDECVFHNIIVEDFKHWGKDYRIWFSESTIKTLKAGLWLDELDAVVKAITLFNENIEHKKKDKKLRDTAAKIDLSGFE